MIIYWSNRDANAFYPKIKELRRTYKFTYGDEVVYEMWLDLLGSTDEQRNRFKMSQITGKAVDEFIRKMRITGVISFRGNGRFIDFNFFESEKIEYILNNYSDYETYANKSKFFEYMGAIDSTVISLSQPVDKTTVSDVRIATLE